MKKWICVTTVAALWLAPSCGFAAEGAASDEMNVTGARVAEQLRDTAAQVNVIPEREIEAVRYHSPTELLDRVPGIFSSGFLGEDAVTSVRVPTSLSNPYTQILIDGLPTTTFGTGNALTWRELNSMDIERIEVLKGPASALYGNTAVGGVINVITKRPGSTPEAGLWGEFGQQSRWRAGLDGGARLDKFAASVNANFYEIEGSRQYAKVEKQVASGNLQYFLDDRSQLRLKVDFVHLHDYTPGALDGLDFALNPSMSYNTFTYNRVNKITPSLTYDRTIGDGGAFKMAFQVQSATDGHSISPASIRNVNIGTTTAPKYVGNVEYVSGLDFDVRTQYVQVLKPYRTRLIGGLDYSNSGQQLDHSTVDITRTAGKFVRMSNQTLDRSFDISANIISPYLQAEMSPIEKLRLTLGGRYDAILYDVTDKYFGRFGGSRDFYRFSFKGGATYDILPNLNAFATYSQGFVAPTVAQLYADPQAANRFLNAQHSDGYEFGLRGNFWENRVKCGISYYDMTIDNVIVQPASTLPYQNIGKTENHGVELTGSIQPIDMVRVSLAYTYSRNTYDNYYSEGRSFNGNLMPRAPENHINARLALLPVKGLEVELEVDEVTKQYADDANLMPYSRPTILNLRANYTWKYVSFWASLLNLTNQNYATYVSPSTLTANTVSYYPGDPRTFYAGVAFKWQ